jgi:hypothetical protein
MADDTPMSLLQGTLDMLILRTLIFGPRPGRICSSTMAPSTRRYNGWSGSI